MANEPLKPSLRHQPAMAHCVAEMFMANEPLKRGGTKAAPLTTERVAEMFMANEPLKQRRSHHHERN